MDWMQLRYVHLDSRTPRAVPRRSRAMIMATTGRYGYADADGRQYAAYSGYV